VIHYPVSVREYYRIFNAAVYRFYKSLTGPPLETDSPFATNPTLAGFSPANTFGNGTHYLSVSYFNGVLDSGFYPIGPNGETYLRLDVATGAQVLTPPNAPAQVQLVRTAGGIIRVQAVYSQAGSLRATEWAITYTTNGSTPGTPPAVSPTATVAMPSGGTEILDYALPAQADLVTVKVRVQSRRNDSGTWRYSEGSTVLTAIADSLGPSVPEGSSLWRGAAPQEL
jgi:hypothetical protein